MLAGLATFLTLMLSVKAIGFVVDNQWLWRFGPALRSHGSHTGMSISTLEGQGFASCGTCKRSAPARPRAALKFVGLTGRFSQALRYLFWTPTLAVCAALVAYAARNSRIPEALPAAIAGLCAVLAIFTLLSAVLVRLSLGPKDVEYSDLSGLPTLMRQRSDHPSAEREGMALHFITMMILSVVLFSAAYSSLSGVQDQIVSSAGADEGVFGWIYYSLTVLATSTDGTIEAAGGLAKLVVAAQLASGPLLLVWFVSLFVSQN